MGLKEQIKKLEIQAVQMSERELWWTPERERQTLEVIDRAHRRDPAVKRADGTVDVERLTDAELLEVHRCMSGSETSL